MPGRSRSVLVLASASTALLLAGMGTSAAGVPSALYHASSSLSAAEAGMSSDWAGWDVTGGTYKSVSASWTQPTVTCSAGETSYSAYWVGLDGDGSKSVEQIGTSADCNNGTPDYSAWYEFYPDASVSLPNTVKAGDKLSASVKYAENGTYTLVLKDSTADWTKTVTGTAPDGTNASAEIIAEAPSGASSGNVLPLADFGSMTFSNVTVNGAALGTLHGARKLTMVDETQAAMATASALTSDNSFSVSYASSGDTSGQSGSGSSGIGSIGGGWPGSGSIGSLGDGSGALGGGSDGSGALGGGSGSTGTGGDGSGTTTDPWGDYWGGLGDGFVDGFGNGFSDPFASGGYSGGLSSDGWLPYVGTLGNTGMSFWSN